MTTTDLIDLYSQQILELSANIPLIGELSNPHGWAQKRSPICGSVVRVGLTLSPQLTPQKEPTIHAFRQDVKACALGQAAAAVLGQYVIGANEPQIRAARDALKSMLQTDQPYNSANGFPELKYLKPAHKFPNRHASILLPFDATIGALESAHQNHEKTK